MTQKLVISKSGFNSLTETDPDNLVFSSDYDTFKYETFGSQAVTVDKSNYYHLEPDGFFGDHYYHRKVETVAHGLGYIPHFIGYIVDVPTSGDVIQAPFAFGDAGVSHYYAVYADATNLSFLVYIGDTANSGTVTINFNYRIFKNEVSF